MMFCKISQNMEWEFFSDFENYLVLFSLASDHMNFGYDTKTRVAKEQFVIQFEKKWFWKTTFIQKGRLIEFPKISHDYI